MHRGVHHLSTQATKAYEDARAKVAKFIGAKSDRDIIFTKNASEALNLVAASWGYSNLKPGDEVYLPKSHSINQYNVEIWQQLCRRCAVPRLDLATIPVIAIWNLKGKTKLWVFVNAIRGTKPVYVVNMVVKNAYWAKRSLSQSIPWCWWVFCTTYIGTQSYNPVALFSGTSEGKSVHPCPTEDLNRAKLEDLPMLQVLLSVAEHHSNLVPWQLVAQKTGAILRHVPLTKDTQEIDMEAIYSSFLCWKWTCSKKRITTAANQTQFALIIERLWTWKQPKFPDTSLHLLKAWTEARFPRLYL